MRRMSELAPAPVANDDAKPLWRCKAWGCEMPGSIGEFGNAYCRYHFGAHTSQFDRITAVVKPEIWRYRLIRCAQQGGEDWRETCKTLCEKYGRPDLDPLMLGMTVIESRRYELLVMDDMEDALKQQVASIQSENVIASDANGEVITPMEMIRRYRAMKTRKQPNTKDDR